MRMRCGFFALLAAAGLVFAGCGKTDTTPPPGTNTDTPTVDIDEGDIVSPDQVTKPDEAVKPDADSGKPSGEDGKKETP